MDAPLELLGAALIVLIPTVPLGLYLGSVLARRRDRPLEADIASGRAPETPFVLIASVGMVITIAVIAVVALTLLARSFA